MRTSKHNAFIARTESFVQRIERKTKLRKQRAELDALTKLNRALGEQRPYIDLDGRERIIGWKQPKRERPRCGAKTRAGGSCKAPAVRGKSRCRMHGGLSTGPKTPEGRARSTAGVKAYWQRWRAAREAAAGGRKAALDA